METGTARMVGNTEFSVISPTQTQMTRVFDAPRQLVWDAYTKAEHIANWWGQTPGATVVEQQDCRPGGTWRYVQKAGEGMEFAFYGEFLEVVEPEKLVSTFKFEMMPDKVATDALTLEDLGDKTRLIAVSTFETPEDLQGMMSTGMAEGANQSWDNLAALLAKLS